MKQPKYIKGLRILMGIKSVNGIKNLAELDFPLDDGPVEEHYNCECNIENGEWTFGDNPCDICLELGESYNAAIEEMEKEFGENWVNDRDDDFFSEDKEFPDEYNDFKYLWSEKPHMETEPMKDRVMKQAVRDMKKELGKGYIPMEEMEMKTTDDFDEIMQNLGLHNDDEEL